MGAGLRSYQCYLNKFTQAINQEAFGNLYKWFFDNLVFDNYTLDFDSTVMVCEGVQEGTVKGYNPKRPGRNSNHPLIAFVSDIRMIADYWLRPGNTVASTKHLSFLEDTLENISGKRGDPIRMDSGFFTKETLDYLEYIVATGSHGRSSGNWLEGKPGLKWPMASRWRKPSFWPKVGLPREGL